MHEMNSILNQEFDSSNEDFIDQLLLSMPPTWPELTEVIGEEMQFPVGGGGGGNNCSEVDNSVQALYNVLAGTMQPGQVSNPAAQHLHIPQAGPMQTQSFGGGDGGPAKPRQRVRAKRGQATDPHSIAERLRRERIAEKMKSLQELVPNSNKTDKASMLEEIIAYVKFLQLQVKVLSMSKMGGTCVVASLVVDLASEQTSNPGGVGTERPANNDNGKVTESRVVKLMEEDMGSAMQYLRGKGLCLMPISLATAIAPLTQANMNNDDDEKI